MQAWESFLDKLKSDLGEETIIKWLRPLKIVHFDAGNLYLEAESSFQIDWFEEHIRAEAKKTFINNNFRPIKIHLTCANKQPLKGKTDKQEILPPSPFVIIRDQLLPDYTKNQFIFSEANQILSHLLTQTISSKELVFNPIFFYGGPCTGKTHLLQAFAYELQKIHTNVLYVRAETFTENLVKAIRNGNMLDFRKSHRHIDVLIIDDVQHLGRKMATQEEFFHTFNTLYNQGKQIILSANVPPGSLQYIEPRLISRFEWGLSLPILKLEKADLLLMVENRCRQLDLPLAEPSRRFIIESFSANPKSIQRALDALYIRASSAKRSLTPPKIQLILKDLLEQEQKEVLSPERIVSHIADFYGLSSKDILSKSQTQECTTPRQLAMFLCRSQLKMPFMKIGEYFNRDHSTVISSVKIMEEKIQKRDKEISPALAAIQQKIQ